MILGHFNLSSVIKFGTMVAFSYIILKLQLQLQNLYALCDLGLSITKELAQDLVPSADSRMPISLPAVLYKPLEESNEIGIQVIF